MKRLIYKLPLIAGCLFLAWVLLLLTGDVVRYYEVDSSVRILGSSFDDLRISVNGFRHIMNAFIFFYNRSGYYNNQLPYFKIGSLTEWEVAFAFMGIYLLFSLILVILALISKRVVPCYILSGGFLGGILLIGHSPEYANLILLVLTWVYLNLVQNFNKLKGAKSIRQFLHEFPVIIFPIYGILLLFVIALPIFMPASSLPETNIDVKHSIFEKLQEIQVVSEQYSDNKRRQEEELKKQRESESWAMESESWEAERENDRQEESAAAYTDDNIKEQEIDNHNESNQSNESNKSNASNESQGLGDSVQEQDDQDSLPGLFASDNAGGGQIGFSLSSGGGVSGGRTDRTGNLHFNGKTVLKVYADSKPEENLYIRLFYAEDYEDNRWKQAEGDHFDKDFIFSRSTVTDYNGDGQPDFPEQVNSDGGMEGFSETGSDGLKEDALLKLTIPTFYSLNSADMDEYLDSEYLHVEYPEDSSKNTSFNCSIWNSIYYPETDSYVLNTCREVPERLQELFNAEYPDVFQSNLTDMTQEQVIAQIDQILEQTAYYTLSPGKAPGSKDFITWFLTENKRGYCMHFASAGVMMLREAGISARYAEGYFVSASVWERQADGRWCAEIKDSNAHAWAEIYSRNDSYNGFWMPVELTPAYDGELAGSFAGQPDVYVGRVVISGAVVKILKVFFSAIGIMVLAAAGIIIYKKGQIWYEKRLLHTGNRRQDVKNMTKLLLKKSSHRNRKIRKIMKQENLSLEEFKEQIPALVPEFSQDAEAPDWFAQFSDYAYKAAFGAFINKQERMEALHLYRKLVRKLNQEKSRKKGI